MTLTSSSFYFASSSVIQAKMRLFQAIGRGGIILLQGPPKVGKTTLIRHFLGELQGEMYQKGYLPLSSFRAQGDLERFLPFFLNLNFKSQPPLTLTNIQDLIFEDLEGGKFWILVFDPWSSSGTIESMLFPWIKTLAEQRNDLPLSMIFLLNTEDSGASSTFQDLSPEIITLTPWDLKDLERFFKQLLKKSGGSGATFPGDFLKTIHKETQGRLDLLEQFAENLLFLSRIHQWEEIPSFLFLHPESLFPSESFPPHKTLPHISPSLEKPKIKEVTAIKTPGKVPIYAPEPASSQGEQALETPLMEEEESLKPAPSPSVPEYTLDLSTELSSLERELKEEEPLPQAPPPQPKPRLIPQPQPSTRRQHQPSLEPEKKVSPPPPTPKVQKAPPQPPSEIPEEEAELNLDALLKEVEESPTPPPEDEVDTLLENLSPTSTPSSPRSQKQTLSSPVASSPPQPGKKDELEEVDEELERLLKDIPE